MKLATKFIYSIILYTIITLIVAGRAYAVNAPDFPACSNPQGQAVASYDSGIHGVPGDPTTYTGRDSVYSQGEGTLSQCLCTNSGQGIQTNWWKVSSLTTEEINILKSQGWILIPDGSAWGLSEGPYLAQNSAFACPAEKGGGNTGGGPGDGLSDGRSDGRGGSVLGAATSVLGLASTGNIMFILSMIAAGFALMGIGTFLNQKKN